MHGHQSHYDDDGNKGTNRQTYLSKGYVTPIDVLSIEEARILRGKYEEWVTSVRQQSPASSTTSDGSPIGDLRFKPHLHLPFINDVAVRNESLLSVVKEVLGTSNILLWSSDFNIKPSKSGGYCSLHQDATYTGLVPAELGLTVWLALSDPVNEESGCLSFWEGTHKAGQFPHIEGSGNENCDEDENMLSRNQRVVMESAANPPRVVYATLRAGQASLHHYHLVHSSGPNRSNRPRIGLALRYIAANVHQTGNTREAVTLIPGSQMEHNGFDIEPVLPLQATTVNIVRGREAHRDSMRREALNYFDGTNTAKAYDETKLSSSQE